MEKDLTWAEGDIISATAVLLDVKLQFIIHQSTFYINPLEATRDTRTLKIGYFLDRHYFACVKVPVSHHAPFPLVKIII